MIWGPIADRFGRVRTLILNHPDLLTFYVLSGFAQTIWQLAIVRLLAVWVSAVSGRWVGHSSPKNGPKIAGSAARGYAHWVLLRNVCRSNFELLYRVRYGWAGDVLGGWLPAVLVRV